MKKAYDTFLQSEVSAESASKCEHFEPYRFECACCGEEVRLAAADSIHMIPHFRHRSGNNDVECERYLGQYGTINIDSKSRKSKNERAEFYFDKYKKTFYLCLCFSESEINTYEQKKAAFELRTSTKEKVIYSLKINSKNFVHDIATPIYLEKFSGNYFLSNTLNGLKRKYEVFNTNGTPTFFKIQGNDKNFKAKLVRSSVLYTNIPYFVTWQTQCIYKTLLLPKYVDVTETFQFETMGLKFFGKVITIKEKNNDIDSLMKQWGYKLDTSETLTLLWPPASRRHDVSIINSNTAFLFSSFTLHAHGNINVHNEDIKIIENRVSKVSVNSKVKIYKKNAEIVIDIDTQSPTDFDTISIEKRHKNCFSIPYSDKHFLFNSSGVKLLTKGQMVYLTPNCVIKSYHKGYLTSLTYSIKKSNLQGQNLLNDLLAHYKRTEVFSEISDFTSLSTIAKKYVKECKKLGYINSSARRFIEVGLI